MEKEQLRDRVISGLEKARRNNKTLGRPVGSVQKDESTLKKYPQAVRRLSEGHSLRHTCTLTGVSINTAKKIRDILKLKKKELLVR